MGLLSFAETFPSGIRDTLWLMLAAVGLLLLIACSNVSSLLLAEGIAREREMAMRAALGAGRGRLLRQLLSESGVLALAGGALGVLLAYVGTKAIIFGLAPAWHGSRTNLAAAFQETGRGSSAGRRHSLARAALVVTQVALSVVLLASAGVMVRTMLAVRSVDLGVKPGPLLTLRIPFAEARYPDSRRRAEFIESLLERLAGTPGVAAAAVNTWFHPFGNFAAPVEIAGQAQQDSRRVTIHSVSPAYLSVHGIPLRRGRFFDEADMKTRRMVAVVSERFVKRYFAERETLGAVVRVPRLRQPPIRMASDQLEIVGVVGDTFGGSFREEIPEIYLPHTLAGLADCLIVRAIADSPMSILTAVRAQVLAIDKDQPVSDVKTLDRRLTESFFSSRQFNAVLFGVFAALGLLLAVVGVYGVLANAVTRRAREIGVRMAMGASLGDIRSLVAGQAARLLSIGIAIGLAATVLTSRLLEDLIWGVRPFDPVSIGAVALLLGLAGLAAAWLPARRAARVDPMTILRYE
ncbi:MAG: ABC transporter permease [Acidobacteria bacterium]|nr:ABC transporter permease [Acidobacteriota bacterium]